MSEPVGKFVVVLGRGSSMAAWPVVKAELLRANLYILSNIDGLEAASPTTLSGAEILTSLRSQACAGLIILASNDYRAHLERHARTEHEALIAHVNTGRPTLTVVGPDPFESAVEFNINRQRYVPERSVLFANKVRSWLQVINPGRDQDDELHPEIAEILQAAFGAEVEELASIAERGQVRYSLFNYRDKVMDVLSYVLCIPPDVNLTQVGAHFKANFGFLTEGAHLLVLVDPRKTPARESRLRQIRDRIPATSVLFLDDFLQRMFLRQAARVEERSARPLIEPRMIDRAGQPVSNPVHRMALETQSDAGASGIVVIQGEGGVGKTTLLKQLGLEMRRPNGQGPGLGGELVVLRARKIVQELAKRPDLQASFTLYNLFQIAPGVEGRLTEQEFAWIFDTGRICIAIDGIDEIIPRLRDTRAMQDFAESVARYSSHMGRGRVFLTCRTSDVFTRGDDPLSPDFAADLYTLLPFGDAQTQDYIEKFFEKDLRQKARAYRFLEELRGSSEASDVDGILPFALRVVCDLVADQAPTGETLTPPPFEGVLDTRRIVDYIVYKVCEREEAKYHYSTFLRDVSSVDMQCRFFVKLAGALREAATINDVQHHLRAFNGRFDATMVAVFVQHPLLDRVAPICFRDDTVAETFLAIGVINELLAVTPPNLANLGDFAERSFVGSPFLIALRRRLQGGYSAHAARLRALVDQARQQHFHNGEAELYYRYAAGLLALGLQLSMNDEGVSAERANRVLKDLFSNDQATLCQPAIHNLNSTAGVVFDFSGLTIQQANIHTYEQFAGCRFDATTRFRHSQIETALNVPPSSTMAASSNFEDCEIDDVFSAALYGDAAPPEAYTFQDAVRQVTEVLERFRLDDTLSGPRSLVVLQSGYRPTTPLQYRDVMDIALDTGLVEWVSQAELRVRIRADEIDAVDDFLTEALYRGRINALITTVYQALP